MVTKPNHAQPCIELNHMYAGYLATWTCVAVTSYLDTSFFIVFKPTIPKVQVEASVALFDWHFPS